MDSNLAFSFEDIADQECIFKGAKYQTPSQIRSERNDLYRNL